MNKTDIDIDIIDIELLLFLCFDSDDSRSDLLKGIAIHYFESTVVDAKNIPRLIKEYPDGTKIELPLPERAKKHFEQYLK